jgi:hypothetical protein
MGGLPLVFLVSFMSAQIDDVKDLHASMKWNDPAIDFVLGKQNGKWVVTHTIVPEIKAGDQIISINRKSLGTNDDANVMLRQMAIDALKGKWSREDNLWVPSSEWIESPVRLKFRRTELVDGRKKTDIYDFDYKPRDLLSLTMTQFNTRYDALNEWITYSPKSVRIIGMTSMMPLLTVSKDGSITTSISITYMGDKWLFARDLTVKSGDVRFELEPTKTTRDVLESAKVVERLIFVQSGRDDAPLRILETLSTRQPSEIIIRVNGQDNYVDHIPSQHDIVVFKNTNLLLHFLDQMRDQ